MTHGHEVLDLLQDKAWTLGELLQAIIEKYGPEETFYTCHADNLSPEELIVFFLQRGRIQLVAGECHHGDGEHEEGHHCCHAGQ